MAGQETQQNTWLMICGYHLLYFKYETFHQAGAALISSELATRDHLTKLTGSWDFYSNGLLWRFADMKTRLKLLSCSDICFMINTRLHFSIQQPFDGNNCRCLSTRAAILTSQWCLVNILVLAEGAELVVIWLRHLDLVMTKLQPGAVIRMFPDPNKPQVNKLATNLLIQGNKCPVVHHREEVNLQCQSEI